jgi:hypothetical protein
VAVSPPGGVPGIPFSPLAGGGGFCEVAHGLAGFAVAIVTGSLLEIGSGAEGAVKVSTRCDDRPGEIGCSNASGGLSRDVCLGGDEREAAGPLLQLFGVELLPWTLPCGWGDIDGPGRASPDCPVAT